jgi:hypothetical protein
MKPFLTALVSVVLSVGGAAQQVLLHVDGTVRDEWLGDIGIVPIGDANGDGIEDFVSGSDRSSISLGLVAYVRAYSGATGAPLWTLSVSTTAIRGVRGGGDVNGDGVGDVLISEPNFFDANSVVPGAVHVVSGATGAIIRTHRGLGGGNFQRMPGGIIGDANGDGFDDYLISDQQYGAWTGWAYLYSGATGQVIRVQSTVATDREYWVSPLGDVDLDGCDDLLISEGGCSGFATCAGALTAYSGRTGLFLYRVQGDNIQQALGVTGGRCGGEDMNGDGVPDFIGVGDIYVNASTQHGMLRAYSGADGSVLWSQLGATSIAQLGFGSGIGDDWNGDGRADVLAFYGGVWGQPNATRIGVFSGLDGSEIISVPNPPGASIGTNLGVMSDITGDGVREFLTRAQYPVGQFPFGLVNHGGIAIVQIGNGPAAYRLHHGRACPASNGYLPHAVLTADPRLGRTARVRLRGTVGGSLAGLMWGVPVVGGIDMSPFGATSCRLYLAPIWYSPFVSTDLNGLAGIDLPVPLAPALTGVVLEGQWFVGDPPANTAGVVLSTAVRIMLGS